jgi:carbamoyltransferase
MLIIGFTGGMDAVYENQSQLPEGSMHDAAAVLLHDGKVVAAIEQERLDRIKHSNKRSADAIKFCLKHYGVEAKDIDAFCYYMTESYLNNDIGYHYVQHPENKERFTARQMAWGILSAELGFELDPNKLFFVEHHMAHAVSAYMMSGFDESLVVTFDGEGNFSSGSISVGKNSQLERIKTFSAPQSLGHFYLAVIEFLGYTFFDEYKVMGLAPYGDPQKYRHILQKFYTLTEEGNYELYMERIPEILLKEISSPRRKGESFSQEHKDIAAALQEAVETIIFHVLKHYRQQTGLRHLSLAGGVAHNCTVNGKILYAGLFDDIFVQPAANDSGCALGAALATYQQLSPQGKKPTRLEHVYWGTDIGNTILSQLNRWHQFINIKKMDDSSTTVAQRLASGSVIGWIQGRSEFGPRALGNRSILADPRPSENKAIINDMVKKREGYRPFAPSVLEECVQDYFEVPKDKMSFPFMIFVLKVKKEVQSLLGAITHVDGTARVQTVSKQTNQKFWHLIDAFGKITGVPVLLNTSFNNHAEPIVDSIDDAVVCFLTTKLDYLVVGDYLVEKRKVPLSAYHGLVPVQPKHIHLRKTKRFTPDQGFIECYECASTHHSKYDVEISESVYCLLSKADGITPLGELLHEVTDTEQLSLTIEETLDLWSRRIISLQPVS